MEASSSNHTRIPDESNREEFPLNIAELAEEKIFKEIFMNAPDAIFIEDFAGNILEINEAACNLHQMTREELLGRNVGELVPPEERENIRESFNKITQNKLKYFEAFSYTKNGKSIPVDIKVRLILYGKIPAVMLIVRDISEKRRIQEELRASMYQYRLLFNLSPSGIIIEDLNGVILDANEAIARSTGYPREYLIGKQIHLLTEPSLYYIVDQNIRDILSGKMLIHEVKSLRNDGTNFYSQLIETIIPLNNGKKVILSISHDITQRKLVELELQHKQRLLEGVISSVLALVSTADFPVAIDKSFELIGRMLNASRVYVFENSTDPKSGSLLMSQKYEWTQENEEPQINNPFLQNLCYQDVCPRWESELGSGNVIYGLIRDFPESEKEALESQGILSLLVIPVFIESHFWGFIGIDDCISPREWSETEISILKIAGSLFGNILVKNAAAETMKTAKEQAEESLKLKTALLNNMSHEFRTPLSGILGFADIIRNENKDTEAGQMAEFISSSGERLLRTLDNVILYSEIESGITRISGEHLEISSIIERVAESILPAAQRNGLKLEVVSLSKCYALIDPVLFSQAVFQIVENAVKFTKSGRISILTECVDIDSIPMVAIYIEDSGIGIPTQYHERIFEAFRQISEGNNRAYEGSGLGLPIARKIIELHNGTINLESKNTPGTVFKILIPSVK